MIFNLLKKIPEDDAYVILMQVVTFEAKQRPDFPHDEQIGGAFVNCYLKGRTSKQAYIDAIACIEESGWDILRFEDQSEIDSASFEKPDDALKYYEQALIDGEVLVFHAYPKDDNSEPEKTPMPKVQKAVDAFLEGANCSQAILTTYGPDYNLSTLDCLKISNGFGGGMRRAEVCGAVTGALMVLGLHYGPKDETDVSREVIDAKVADLTSRFEAKCGSFICRDLLGCDLSTPEGKSHIAENDLFKTVCPDMVRVAAEILEDLCE